MGRGMKAGKRPKQHAPGGSMGGGRKAQMQQLQQLQEVQKQMEDMQRELDEQEVSASVGGGMVTATMSGKKELKALKIDPDAVDPDDVETLQDLVIAAVNECLRQIEEMSENAYGSITGGIGIPGL